MSTHESHPNIIKRLKKSEGHIKSVIKMLESGRSCLDIAQQLHAVEKAINSAKKTLIHDHIDHCLNESISENKTSSELAVKEFKEITKYL
ncbi:metal-sensing transcriptional repressor [Aliarcobacter cryaerophilus]|uniref:metal-sensing transcriptional repressor n=1 Tax=Aliarcobacter cryaerophilus TaxID=28198 RepID=UPI003DA66BC7